MADPTHEADQLKDGGHDYDGIQEYDNELPRWWLVLFYATIVWAIWYVPFYSFGGGQVGASKLAEDQRVAAVERAKTAGPIMDEAGLRALTTDPARIVAGKESYAQFCVTCHGADGSGLVGPNLRDRSWIFGSNMIDLIAVLEKGGREGKGMTPFGHLGTEKVRNLAVYIVAMNREGHLTGKAPGADEKEAVLDY
ncbi:MAG: cbb3-type cytochrome c oxidase N-terminal domain-containing protein [Planctomycetota bacterium]